MPASIKFVITYLMTYLIDVHQQSACMHVWEGGRVLCAVCIRVWNKNISVKTFS